LYEAILAKCRVLKPERVELTKRPAKEPLAYDLVVVAACFEGLALEKREQLVKTVARKEVSECELTITALAPAEDA